MYLSVCLSVRRIVHANARSRLTEVVWHAGDIIGALYFDENGAYNDDAIGDLPNLPVPFSYPQYGGFALLPLEAPNYTAQVHLLGWSL